MDGHLAESIAIYYYDAMDLNTLYRQEGRQGLRRLADLVHTPHDYLYQLATGRGSPGPKMVSKLVAADKRLTRSELRPDLWPPE